MYYFSLCAGGPSGFGLFADWLLSHGGGVSFGATANHKGGCGGVPIIIDMTSRHTYYIHVLNQVISQLRYTDPSIVESKVHRALLYWFLL